MWRFELFAVMDSSEIQMENLERAKNVNLAIVTPTWIRTLLEIATEPQESVWNVFTTQEVPSVTNVCLVSTMSYHHLHY